MEEKYCNNENDKTEGDINIREILFLYLNYWKWFLVSFIVCILSALIYLRISTPVYEISSIIMIKDEKKGESLSNEMGLFDGMNILGNTNTDNEIEVLKSKSLIRDVIKELALYINYMEKGVLKKKELYKSSPILVDTFLFNVDDLVYPLRITLKDLKTRQISIKVEVMNSEDETIISDTYSSFPVTLETPYGKILLLKLGNVEDDIDISELVITISKPINLAKAYLNDLTVVPANKNSSVVKLNFKNTNPLLGEDFLNKLIEKYNTNAVEYKNKIAQRTAEFIEERIALIGKKLGRSESEIENYKKNEGLTEIKINSELFLRESTEYERKRVDNETQLNLIYYLNEYVNNP